MNIDALYFGECLITFKYSDGSEIQCISTLNKDILRDNYIESVDGLVDLLTMRLIPTELFIDAEEIYIESKSITNLTELDEFFQSKIKRRWKPV